MNYIRTILVTLPFWSAVSMAFTPHDLCTTLTATRGRKIACALLITFAAHKAYKAYCHAAIRKQAATAQPHVGPSSGPTRWVFAHGIADNYNQAEKYVARPENSCGFMEGQCYRIGFEDAIENLRATYNKDKKIPWGDLATLRTSALGQHNDMHAIKSLVEQYQHENLILFGVSRGASTIINYVATHKPGNVKAIILESPYDSMESAVHGLLARIYLSYIPGISTIGDLACAALFKNYSTCDIAPRDVIEHIPAHIPVLIVCSQQDQLVPAASSKKLYHALINAGRKNVFLFEAEYGVHGKIIDGFDGTKYHDKVTNFLAWVQRQ